VPNVSRFAAIGQDKTNRSTELFRSVKLPPLWVGFIFRKWFSVKALVILPATREPDFENLRLTEFVQGVI